jgi:acyl-CoA synthetase (AMP-forming)/AMP-acid ligase II
MTIGNLFEKNARFFPDKTVQVFEDGRRQSYRELDERANRLANGLLNLGLQKGDHVAMLAMNCLEYMEYQLATAKLGIISVLVNCFMPKDRIAYMLNYSDSKGVIFERQYLEAVEYALGQPSKLEHLIMIGRMNTGKLEGVIEYEDLIRESSGAKPAADIKITDPNSLMFTTGTTGMPKAVLKSMAADMYHSIISAIYYPYYDAVHKLGFPPYSHLVSLVMPPQFHLGGQSSTLIPLIFPRTMVLMRAFDPEKFLKFIDREKVNSTWVQPAMLYRIKRLPEETIKKYDVSSVISIICGSTALKEQERKDLEAFFYNAKLGSSYAATEFAMAAYISQEELAHTRPDNLGIPVFCADIKIMDDQDRELPPKQIGHIWVKSPGLPVGCQYYKDEEATRKGFRDGWAIVGDMGWQDEKGYFYYYGRSDDMIMSGGEKISPLPIEEVIQQHPKISAAAVVGIPDEKWQEAVAAAVVPKREESISQEEVVSFCRGKVATYEVPKRVYVLEELPVGTTGKVNRRRLKDLIKEINGK